MITFHTFGDSHCKQPWSKMSINYDTSLISGGYVDSFSMVVVLMFLEKTFDVKIPDKEATPNNFDTVNKMVELVNKFKK